MCWAMAMLDLRDLELGGEVLLRRSKVYRSLNRRFHLFSLLCLACPRGFLHGFRKDLKVKGSGCGTDRPEGRAPGASWGFLRNKGC